MGKGTYFTVRLLYQFSWFRIYVRDADADAIAVIDRFGGDPNKVTVAGQSGGGFAVVGQMTLYDGDSQGLFHQAVPRSVQRSSSYTIDELKVSGQNYSDALSLANK